MAKNIHFKYRNLWIYFILLLVWSTNMIGQKPESKDSLYQYIIYQPAVLNYVGLRAGYGRQINEQNIVELETGYLYSRGAFQYADRLFGGIPVEPTQYFQARLIRPHFSKNAVHSPPRIYPYWSISTSCFLKNYIERGISYNQLGFAMIFDFGVKMTYFKYMQTDFMVGIGYFGSTQVFPNNKNNVRGQFIGNHMRFENIAFRITCRQGIQIKNSFFKKRK